MQILEKYRSCFLSAFSGILLILIFPRFDLEILAWIALVPLFSAMVGKNASNRESTDEEVIARVKAFIKNINETLKSLPESHAKKDTLEREKELLKKYLPQQMSEETLKEIIKKIGVTHEKSIKSMGKVMGELKAKYGGQYDGKMASNFVKSFLNE